jgi:outer membrane protein TolC
MKRIAALLAAVSLLAPAVWPQAAGSMVETSQLPDGYWNRTLLNNYRYPTVRSVSFANSSRFDKLIRAGRLYLSLQDAIALTLENNLDIAIARLNFDTAKADLLRSEAGGALRGIPTAIRAGSGSAVATAVGTGGANTGASGAGAGFGGGGAGGGDATNVGGVLISQTGTAIPNYDEQLFASWNYGRTKRPQANLFVTGVPFLQSFTNSWTFGFQKGFSSGGQLQVTMNNNVTDTNNRNVFINPFTTAGFSTQFTQPLLQGFGQAVNKRFILSARNNIKVNDLVFKQQVITTVASVLNLYSDLVSFTENVRVRRQALAYAEKLRDDNRKQVEIGTLAPIEVVRAEAEVAARLQDVTVAETQLLQQEVIIKNSLSRTGVSDPALAQARIVPLDKLAAPAPVAESLDELVTRALEKRPELQQIGLNLENARIQLKGAQSLMRPQFNLVVATQNNAQAGTLVGGIPPAQLATVPPIFIGNYGDIVKQLGAFDFNDWNIGLQFIIPLRNRVAKADAIRDQLTIRQQEINRQQQSNSIRVGVSNAVIQVQQARAQYQAAVKARELQEQSLDAEQKKFNLGASTIFFVIQSQRDLANAQGQEVAAMNNYTRARVALEVATGTLLDSYGIDLEEARQGEVERAPSDAIGQ